MKLKFNPTTVFGSMFAISQSLLTFYQQHQATFSVISTVCGILFAHFAQNKGKGENS